MEEKMTSTCCTCISDDKFVVAATSGGGCCKGNVIKYIYVFRGILKAFDKVQNIL
jgi:hypothetical protein